MSWARFRLKIITPLIMLAGLTGCIVSGQQGLPVPPPFVPTQNQLPEVTQPSSADSIVVYFTDPLAPTVDVFSGGPDEKLAAAIDSARMSLDVAVYDLNLWSIRDALLSAHRRGVPVRIITESDNLDEAEIQELKTAGIPVLGDRREGYMHNKFTVVDRAEVWTGSMNYTVNDAYRNNNHLIKVRSVKMAENYTTEFEEMWSQDLFGRDDLSLTPNQVFQLDGSLLEVYFSPDDHTASRLVELIQDAQESIYFLAYSFTSDDIAEAMLERATSGVAVSGVFDTGQVDSNTGGEYERLLSSGLDVRLDGSPRSMHHKLILIDRRTVVAGSYNFSANAERSNDENTIVIHSPVIAAQFLAEFNTVFREARR